MLIILHESDPSPSFFKFLPKQLVLLFQLLKYFSFEWKGKVIVFSFIIKLIYKKIWSIFFIRQM